jgi:hypothetical protein
LSHGIDKVACCLLLGLVHGIRPDFLTISLTVDNTQAQQCNVNVNASFTPRKIVLQQNHQCSPPTFKRTRMTPPQGLDKLNFRISHIELSSAPP